MAAKKAGRHFTVGATSYAPGDEVPADVVDLVDNPDVWSADEDETPKATAKKATAKKAASSK